MLQGIHHPQSIESEVGLEGDSIGSPHPTPPTVDHLSCEIQNPSEPVWCQLFLFEGDGMWLKAIGNQGADGTGASSMVCRFGLHVHQHCSHAEELSDTPKARLLN